MMFLKLYRFELENIGVQARIDGVMSWCIYRFTASSALLFKARPSSLCPWECVVTGVRRHGGGASRPRHGPVGKVSEADLKPH